MLQTPEISASVKSQLDTLSPDQLLAIKGGNSSTTDGIVVEEIINL